MVNTTKNFCIMDHRLFTPSYKKDSMRDIPIWVECLVLVIFFLVAFLQVDLKTKKKERMQKKKVANLE